MALVALPNVGAVPNAGPVARIQWNTDPIKAIARAGADAHIDLAADCCAASLAKLTAPQNQIAGAVAYRTYQQSTHSVCNSAKGPAHICTDFSVDSTSSLVSRIFALFSRAPRV
jgi:hypothetical protein